MTFILTYIHIYVALKAEAERQGKGLDAYFEFKEKEAEKRLEERLSKRKQVRTYIRICYFYHICLLYRYMCVKCRFFMVDLFLEIHI